MNIKSRKAKLEQRKRRHARAVNAKYRKLIKQVEGECLSHEFGEWSKRWDGLDSYYQTNFRGDIIYFRSCKHCGKTESEVSI